MPKSERYPMPPVHFMPQWSINTIPSSILYQIVYPIMNGMTMVGICIIVEDDE
jgi:uncharacterized membrane-anchored protein YitT (DUF2179 family)